VWVPSEGCARGLLAGMLWGRGSRLVKEEKVPRKQRDCGVVACAPAPRLFKPRQETFQLVPCFCRPSWHPLLTLSMFNVMACVALREFLDSYMPGIQFQDHANVDDMASNKSSEPPSSPHPSQADSVPFEGDYFSRHYTPEDLGFEHHRD